MPPTALCSQVCGTTWCSVTSVALTASAARNLVRFERSAVCSLGPICRLYTRETTKQKGRFVPEVVIEVTHNGPYRIRGTVRLIDADGNEYDLADPELPAGGPERLGFLSLCR